MSGAIERAALYLPGGGERGRGRRAWDEDRFTLLATALERLLGDRSAPARVAIVGEPPAGTEGTLAALLGEEVVLSTGRAGGAGLGAALAEAATAGEPAAVVAAELSEDGGAHGWDGSVAFLLSSEGQVGTELLRGPTEPGATALGAARAWWSAVPPQLRAGWTGDWGETPAPGTSPPAPDPDLRAVSQGAYWPRRRYLEGLGARWRLEAERCSDCHHVTFPPRGRCAHCGRGDGLRRERLPAESAEVIAVTWIGPGGQPTEFDRQVDATGPYGVAIVAFGPDAVRGTFQVADGNPRRVEIGDRVGTALRRLYPLDGEWRYGRKLVLPEH